MQYILEIFLNRNVFNFIITTLFFTAILIKIFPIFNKVSNSEQISGPKSSCKNHFKEILLQLIFGLIISICLILCNVITSPWSFINKKLFLINSCQELQGCIENTGAFYLPKALIQYSDDPNYYRIVYHYTIGDERKLNSVFIAKKFILGWED
jgi:hypothetical protein